MGLSDWTFQSLIVVPLHGIKLQKSCHHSVKHNTHIAIKALHLQLHQAARRPIKSHAGASVLHTFLDNGQSDVDKLAMIIHTQDGHKCLYDLVWTYPPRNKNQVLSVGVRTAQNSESSTQ